MTKVTKKDALNFHFRGKPGKYEIKPTKPLVTQRDLSLAYSPGVAYPCLEIEKDPAASYEYTNRGNTVAVITNGTAVLGLGAIGALASKPVMEGKAVLFKKFADVDSIDLELDTTDIDTFVNAVKILEPSFGGINLEDIKAPECFIIEERLREEMNIPVFHDDQHGTAIVAAAGIINAVKIAGKTLEDITLVVNGAGAAAIACTDLIVSLGVRPENIIMCDSKGVVYQGRTEGMNQWKSKYANATAHRTLAEAMVGADVFFGLSVKGAVSPDMLKNMADTPIVFAMANPDPEITPEEAHAVRSDVIVATGRSDFPNQVNNVLGFPFIFRGALDVRATTINEEMKMAAAIAIANLAECEIPEDIAEPYGMENTTFGKEYIIPMPFDYRLASIVPTAVAKAAMESGVAQKPLEDLTAYENTLRGHSDSSAGAMQAIFSTVQKHKKRVVYADGEDHRVIRAANAFAQAGYGIPVLVGDENVIADKMQEMGIEEPLEVWNHKTHTKLDQYKEVLYKRLWRKGFLKRDIERKILGDKHIFALSMVQQGDADAIVLGVNRTYSKNFDTVDTYLPPSQNALTSPIGVMMIVTNGRTVFISDAVGHSTPTSEELANIAQVTAGFAKRMGHKPRAAFLSFSTFGMPKCGTHKRIRGAIDILDERTTKFEYEGDMMANIALNYQMQKDIFPETNLSGAANILIMPNLSSASISSRLLQELGDGTVIGPLMLGYSQSVQIAQMANTANDLVNLGALAAYDVICREEKNTSKS